MSVAAADPATARPRKIASETRTPAARTYPLASHAAGPLAVLVAVYRAFEAAGTDSSADTSAGRPAAAVPAAATGRAAAAHRATVARAAAVDAGPDSDALDAD